MSPGRTIVPSRVRDTYSNRYQVFSGTRLLFSAAGSMAAWRFLEKCRAEHPQAYITDAITGEHWK